MADSAVVVKRPWTPEEDELLIAAVSKHGASRWSMIATMISTGRVGKQCRERWNNHLCPEVKKGSWSTEEDHAIMHGVAVLGSRWCDIVKDPTLAGRTDNAIKNRFYSLERNMKAKQTGAPRGSPYGKGEQKEEDEATEPVPQTKRVLALALELAFTTDEHDRDVLIEKLTAASAPTDEEYEEAVAVDAALDFGVAELCAGSSLEDDTVADLAAYLHQPMHESLPASVAATFTDLADYLELPQEKAITPCTSTAEAASPCASGRLSAVSTGSSDAESEASTIRAEACAKNTEQPTTAVDSPPLSARKRRSPGQQDEAKWCQLAPLSPIKLSDAPPSIGTEETGNGMCETAACLGGRLAHKALLAPLALPLDETGATDSPKRMRTTPSGASAVPWHMRRPSALAVSPSAPRLAADGLIRPSPLRAMTGTKEPSMATAATSPATATTGTKESGVAAAASPLAATTGTKEPGMGRNTASPDFTWMCGGAELFEVAEFADLFAAAQ